MLDGRIGPNPVEGLGWDVLFFVQLKQTSDSVVPDVLQFSL